MRRTIELTTSARPLLAPALREMLLWAALGILAIAVVYQLPAGHDVAVGYNDSAYVQGFADPLNRWGVVDTAFGTAEPFRRSTADAALLFPQIGLPAEATLRWRSASDGPVRVRVLQGNQELASVELGPEWTEQHLSIRGGLLKPNDVVLRLLAEPPDGVLLQHAALRTTGWPIVPYPAQLAYGGIAVALGTLLLRGRASRGLFVGSLAVLFLLLYRLQLSPFPLRNLLPGTALLLAAVAGVRALPRLRSLDALATAATAALILAWLGWVVLQSQSHLVLSLPGVERDFPVFASRAAALMCPGGAEQMSAPCVLRADGFYQVGYPFLLWAARLSGASAFVAARSLAMAAGLVLLLATWALGRRLYSPSGALLAVAMTALSPIVVQYSISLGTDMPFAALWIAALAALLVPRRHTAATASLAGALCGLAFVLRHPGLVLLPFGIVALGFGQNGGLGVSLKSFISRFSVLFVLGWLVAASPQLIVNVTDTGNPLYNRQAKNIWLAVYADIDYSRWNEAGDDIRLSDLVLADPARFFGNWGRNLKAFVATGGEDTSEFGRAIGLRLLGFPANVLAVAGVLWWLWRGGPRERLLVLAGALYVAGVAVGFALPRFFLPVAPILALAAVAPIMELGAAFARRWTSLSQVQWRAVLALGLLVCLAAGPRIGARYVLERQDAAAAEIARAVLARNAAGTGVSFELPAGDMLDDASAISGLGEVEPAAILVLGGDLTLPSLAGREPFAAAGQYRAYEIR